jgi:hypothetical protein
MMVRLAAAAPIWADYAAASGSPVIGDSAQIRINRVKVQYIDSVSAQMVTLVLDAIFAWNPETYVLMPIAIAGGQSSQLRVQVGSTVTGEPIANAVVSAGVQQVRTDEDGIARFFGLSDAPLFVRVAAIGYDGECLQVQIPPWSWKRIAVGLMGEAAQ